MAMMTEMRTQGMSVRKILGKDVMGTARDKIGEVDDLILSSSSGCAMFSIVDEGGYLGMAEKHHVVPWDAFSWTADDRLMVPFDQDKLRKAPVFDRSSMPDWGNETWQRGVYDYYGLPYRSSMGMGGSMTGGTMGGTTGGGTTGGGTMGGTTGGGSTGGSMTGGTMGGGSMGG
jgi:sporulation protein YlmC with PRC-barrel domain